MVVDPSRTRRANVLNKLKASSEQVKKLFGSSGRWRRRVVVSLRSCRKSRADEKQKLQVHLNEK